MSCFMHAYTWPSGQSHPPCPSLSGHPVPSPHGVGPIGAVAR